MDTIVIRLDEADFDLVAAIRHLRESGNCAVLTDADVAVAEIRPFPLVSNVASVSDKACFAEGSVGDGDNEGRTGPRVVFSKLTGLPVVTAWAGARNLTSEEICEWLRGAFP